MTDHAAAMAAAIDALRAARRLPCSNDPLREAPRRTAMAIAYDDLALAVEAYRADLVAPQAPQKEAPRVPIPTPAAETLRKLRHAMAVHEDKALAAWNFTATTLAEQADARHNKAAGG